MTTTQPTTPDQRTLPRCPECEREMVRDGKAYRCPEHGREDAPDRCPCGGEFGYLMLLTNPPKYRVTCQKCGARADGVSPEHAIKFIRANRAAPGLSADISKESPHATPDDMDAAYSAWVKSEKPVEHPTPDLIAKGIPADAVRVRSGEVQVGDWLVFTSGVVQGARGNFPSQNFLDCGGQSAIYREPPGPSTEAASVEKSTAEVRNDLVELRAIAGSAHVPVIDSAINRIDSQVDTICGIGDRLRLAQEKDEADAKRIAELESSLRSYRIVHDRITKMAVECLVVYKRPATTEEAIAQLIERHDTLKAANASLRTELGEARAISLELAATANAWHAALNKARGIAAIDAAEKGER